MHDARIKRGSFSNLSLHGSAPGALRPSLEKKFFIAARKWVK